jgi:hypothetical protein
MVADVVQRMELPVKQINKTKSMQQWNPIQDLPIFQPVECKKEPEGIQKQEYLFLVGIPKCWQGHILTLVLPQTLHHQSILYLPHAHIQFGWPDFVPFIISTVSGTCWHFLSGQAPAAYIL